ncbi:MAG TPA: S8 family serine peptidase [Vampirovibrionales bacterium]
MFDPNFYRQIHPDLVNMTVSEAHDHYVQFGLLEERLAHPGFSLRAYLRRYPDLRAADWIKGSHASALHHWNLYGKAEGRDASLQLDNPSATPLFFRKDNGFGLISVSHALRRVGCAMGQKTGRGVVVAIIDSGVQEGAAKFWQNLKESANGQDDDGDGLLDNFSGWDFVDGDPIANDLYGHGTRVAQFLTTIAPDCEVMPLRILDHQGLGTGDRLIAAVNHAILKKANIINLSLQIPDAVGVEGALRTAANQGIMVCFAAGNDSKTTPGGIAARADQIGGIVVGCASTASNKAGTVQNFVQASGIYSSLATPIVAGLAALLKEANPALSGHQLIEIIRNTAANVLP